MFIWFMHPLFFRRRLALLRELTGALPSTSHLAGPLMASNVQKQRERIYLESFMRLKGWSGRVVDREAPDFVIERPECSIALEITEALRDPSPKGSGAKASEQANARTLRGLCAHFYEAGGLPARVQALWPQGRPDSFAGDRVQRLIETRRLLEEWDIARLRLTARETYYVTALPVALGQYSGWTCATDFVGVGRTIPRETLEGIIDYKAGKLPRYRQAASRVALLIVADLLTNAGRWRLSDDPTPIDSRGFDAVYLLEHPERVRRVDGGGNAAT